MTNAKENQNHNSLFPKIKPWPDVVDGGQLIQELVDTIQRFVHLPEGAAILSAFWISHTYLDRKYTFTPRLFIYSPEPRCGKTTFLDILELLCYNPLAVSGITGSAMKRIIASESGITLLIDEADRFLNNDNNQLCQIINCGYQFGKMVVCSDTNNKKIEPRVFNCFAPCSIAAIGNIPHTIMDRSIVIKMERKKDSERLEKLRYRNICEKATELQQKCKRYISDHQENILNAWPVLPDELNDRTADVSEILFAIADTISPEWHKKLENAILTLVNKQQNNDSVSLRTQLLSDIKTIFEERRTEWISSVDLVMALNQIETSPWTEWNKGRGLTTNALAYQLRYFEIYPKQTRENEGRERKYYLKDFADIFDRYLPPANCDTVPDGANKPTRADDPEKTGNDQSNTDCHDVTDETLSKYGVVSDMDVPF